MADKKKARKPESAIVQQPVAQLPTGYAELLEDLKVRILSAQIRAGLAANRELVLLYWEIGRRILHQQKTHGWGAKVVERLARDLRNTFPDMKGFSRANLLYMRAFAESYPDASFVQQAAGQIPWFQNCILLDKVKDSAERQWYMHQTIQHGWSRNVLVHQIESGLYRRQGKATTNFDRTLPAPQSELAKAVLDCYSISIKSICPPLNQLLHFGVRCPQRGFVFQGEENHAH